MYSLGMRGSWWEKTFCKPTSHIRIFLLDFCDSELPMTWNSMMPRRSSSRAVSSRAALADSRLVCGARRGGAALTPLRPLPGARVARGPRSPPAVPEVPPGSAVPRGPAWQRGR